jgi:hypothetical protein
MEHRYHAVPGGICNQEVSNAGSAAVVAMPPRRENATRQSPEARSRFQVDAIAR